MATAGQLQFTYAMKAHLLKGELDLDGSNQAKLAIVTSSSNISASSDLWSNVTGEISDSGYTTGGMNTTLSVGSAGTSVPITMTSVSVTAIDGFVARYAVLYQNVSGQNYVIGYATLNSAGTDVTVGSGTTLNISCAGNLITLS